MTEFEWYFLGLEIRRNPNAVYVFKIDRLSDKVKRRSKELYVHYACINKNGIRLTGIREFFTFSEFDLTNPTVLKSLKIGYKKIIENGK